MIQLEAQGAGLLSGQPSEKNGDVVPEIRRQPAQSLGRNGHIRLDECVENCRHRVPFVLLLGRQLGLG
jgi:hypothetical protein